MSNKISIMVESYLEYKRNLGFQLIGESYFLRAFARYTEEVHYAGSLTREIVFQWCESGDNPSLTTKGRRFEPLKGLADYAYSFDQDSELLPRLPYGNPHKRKRPHIYTIEETCLLMDKSNSLYSPDGLRAITMRTAIGLLWSTGLRTSELVNLKVSDVDFDSGILIIQNSKFNKDRIVPVLPTVSKQLALYREKVEAMSPSPIKTDAFFITTNGVALKANAFEYAFQKIRDCVNTGNSEYEHVRLYDFRHTFATRTIRKWLEQNEDVNAKLFLLSTYMGHNHPEDTFWYLSSTPELMDLSSNKYEHMFGGLANE